MPACPPILIMGLSPLLFGWLIALAAGFLGAIVGLLAGLEINIDARHKNLKAIIKKLKKETAMFGLGKKKQKVEEEFAATIDDLKIKYAKYGDLIERTTNIIEGMSPALRKEYLTALKKVVK
ncbi:MAG: hypothetical protein A2Z08_07980 [Deltaproteobacteria bacterium RBG_16_54_11]|nr:MAG: hypothetical protein A2Z08_07980 [Deltaproteobacteria bacterium RBG_16_54_11]